MTGSAATFSWVAPDLAVGGAFPEALAETLAREHGIAAVIDLRSEACDDAELLSHAGLALLHLPTEDLCAVTQPMLDRGVAYATDCIAGGQRVLIHCEHGIGRSVTLALCVMVARGTAPLDAMEAIKTARPVASPSPEQFEAWSAWLQRHGTPPPPFEAFTAIAYRHLAQA